MARLYTRHGSAVTLQDSAAITAGSLSSGTQTVMDVTAGGNFDGALAAEMYVNVTVGPSGGAATAELYMAASKDGTNYAEEGPDAYGEFALSVKIPTNETGDFRLGVLYDLPQKAKFKLKAVSYGFTASLVGVPVYVADA